MKKKAILRGILGFPLGIAIGYAISIGISLVWAEGYYAPCVPELITVMGNEINAVILQTLLSGLIGTGFAAASVIWEAERWSLMVQTGVYFIVVSIIMMPAAYVTYWMEHTIGGFLSYFGIFALVFVIIWAVEVIIGRYLVHKMNRSLCERQKGEGDIRKRGGNAK